ncbi:MAG TPA: hypothetical protein VHY37_04890 [Tepidisphaeraceae bacterium]|nr:hypothetical protein [Tepidisphaeraceae bacterium]
MDAGGSEDHVESGGELRIAVGDEITAFFQDIAAGHGEIASDLAHPGVGEIGRDAAEVDLARLDVDEDQDVMRDQAEGGPDFGTEEVGGEQAFGMRFDELGPACRVLPPGRRVDAVFFEDVL